VVVSISVNWDAVVIIAVGEVEYVPACDANIEGARGIDGACRLASGSERVCCEAAHRAAGYLGCTTVYVASEYDRVICDNVEVQ
jgi:hypothetical protein